MVFQDSPAAVYKCLADDTRLRTLLLLRTEGELCVCEMTSALNLSQPKLSRHLAQLRNSGLISDSRQGQWVFYQISASLPGWIGQVLDCTLTANEGWLRDDRSRLAAMGERPVRQTANC